VDGPSLPGAHMYIVCMHRIGKLMAHSTTVAGLLAGLCLRYDASRATDLRPRACVSMAAIEESLAKLPQNAQRREIGEAAADAAAKAYDSVADEDDARRDATTSGSEASDDGGPPPTRVVTDVVMCQRRYFAPVMAAYGIGLGMAFGINAATGAGQPALLYLCPLTVSAVVATAVSRREVGRVWSFLDLPSTKPPTRKA
jgi:Signal peptide peptidase